MSLIPFPSPLDPPRDGDTKMTSSSDSESSEEEWDGEYSLPLPSIATVVEQEESKVELRCVEQHHEQWYKEALAGRWNGQDIRDLWCNHDYTMYDFHLWLLDVQTVVFPSLDRLKARVKANAFLCIRIVTQGAMQVLLKESQTNLFALYSVRTLRNYHVPLWYRSSAAEGGDIRQWSDLTSLLKTDECFVVRELVWIPVHPWVSIRNILDDNIRRKLESSSSTTHEVFNTFYPWKAKRVDEVDKSLIDPVLDHMERVWCNNEAVKFECLLGKLSFAVKYPHSKDDICTVLYGQRGGEGKTSLLRWFRDCIYGKENSRIPPGVIDSVHWPKVVDHTKVCGCELWHHGGEGREPTVQGFSQFSITNSPKCLVMNTPTSKRRVFTLCVDDTDSTIEERRAHLTRLFNSFTQTAADHLFTFLLDMFPQFRDEREHYLFLQFNRPETPHIADVDVLEEPASPLVKFYDDLISGAIELGPRFYKQAPDGHTNWSNHKLLFNAYQRYLNKMGVTPPSMTVAAFRHRLVDLGMEQVRNDSEGRTAIHKVRGYGFVLPSTVALGQALPHSPSPLVTLLPRAQTNLFPPIIAPEPRRRDFFGHD